MKGLAGLVIALLCPFYPFIIAFGAEVTDFKSWEELPTSQESLQLTPTLQSTRSVDHLNLCLKHFAHPGAQPILLIHGLSQNDRIWDSTLKKYSAARFFHSQGFDVWVGNLRASGTQGFKSDFPSGPFHWNVEDYAIKDIPKLVDAVREQTQKKPWIIGHSLAAWALEGYLAGLDYDHDGNATPHWNVGEQRQASIQGMVTLAGVYNMWWEKSLKEARTNPIRNEEDYYHSNYELELASQNRFLFYTIPNLSSLPLNWMSSLISPRFCDLPWFGNQLGELYHEITDSFLSSPLLSMFYYPPNNDPEVVRLHGIDGMEDISPHLIEQLGNALNNHLATSYYHLNRPQNAFEYHTALQRTHIPLLFVAGGKDRLANSQMIYQDGYLQATSPDKFYLHVENFGHLDIINGIHAAHEVMEPVAKWMRDRS